MKILLISIPSIHAIRWIENLKDTNHELYWFDILDAGRLDTSINITQFTNWKTRKVKYIKGEYFLRKKMNRLYNTIQPFLEVTASEKLQEILELLQPDLVHSFEMQSCSYPILKTMNVYADVKWLYSCWGSDMYFYQKSAIHLVKIKEVLKRVDYLHTDCKRDLKTATNLGFSGNYLGAIPGGGGYNIESFQNYIKPKKKRNVILVKGYEHKFGRAINIIKAIQLLELDLDNYKVVVFGAHPIVVNYIKENELPFKCYSKNELTQQELLKIMGQSLIYIGNSVSDGMPNTLLEAIIMGAFPIQSNPGGATAEIIDHGTNGLLIEDPEDISSIKTLILKALQNMSFVEQAFLINQDIAKKRLDYAANQQKIIDLYQLINIKK